MREQSRSVGIWVANPWAGRDAGAVIASGFYPRNPSTGYPSLL